MANDLIQCTAGAMGRHGEAAAEIAGRRVHVAYALPGETVKASVDGAHARAVEIVHASPERAAPFCPHFGACGGCALQHWQEAPYRAWKRDLVATALARRGIAAPVGDLVDAQGAGRRRVKMTARHDRAGFLAYRRHDLVAIAQCPAAVPALSNASTIARDLARLLVPPRRAIGVLMTATSAGLDAEVTEAVAVEGREAELARLAERHDLARLTVGGEVMVRRRPALVRFGEVDVELPPGGFLQATEAGERAMAELVIEATAGARRIADLFSGAGPFALRLAQRMPVAAFDLDRAAVAALDAAWRRATGLKPVTARARDLFRAPLAAIELEGVEAVVFDPPRQGAETQAKHLARSGVPLVIAVSCDPASLARDLALLVAGGYRLERVTPIDQFKWTPHVEAVAVLVR
jgi:23S rRNA (uracil1939-C5)-methyltransferase